MKLAFGHHKPHIPGRSIGEAFIGIHHSDNFAAFACRKKAIGDGHGHGDHARGGDLNGRGRQTDVPVGVHPHLGFIRGRRGGAGGRSAGGFNAAENQSAGVFHPFADPQTSDFAFGAQGKRGDVGQGRVTHDGAARLGVDDFQFAALEGDLLAANVNRPGDEIVGVGPPVHVENGVDLVPAFRGTA
ncbi:MAG TPA: hypothetical protein PKZ00_01150, partial [Elusimicrobiota bacterium]|nr:hypothetical protein [Elusimicrobiota bacterium]